MNVTRVIFLLLFTATFFTTSIKTSSGQDHSTAEVNGFSWPQKMRESIQKSLVTRSKNKVELTIPMAGNGITFQIRTKNFIDNPQINADKSFQSFTGRDDNDQPVFGYFIHDEVYLSFYDNGRIVSIAPNESISDWYEIQSTEDPESFGAIECSVAAHPEVEIRRGGNTISCQNQGYSSISFDLFIVCTGEWGSYFNSQYQAKQAIIRNFTTLNTLYAGELNITFSLILRDEFVYMSSFSDPFNPNASSRADEARDFFNDYVTESFDIGHVLHRMSSGGTSGSGVAYLAKSCDDNYKGGGWTGTTKPNDVNFNIRLLGHEIGHQLGADHTFYGTLSNCSGGNRSRGNGFEPGSGSSLMAYEGNCGSHNLDGPRSGVRYFHTHSASQIFQRIHSQNSCGFRSGQAYNLSVEMPRNFSIPVRTAFDLTATSTNQHYAYTWEQYDTDNSSSPGSTKSDPINGGNYTTTPMYRSYDPSTSGNHRSFPSREVQTSGITKRGEVYATVARDITMRLTTRYGGAIQCNEMTVSVTDDLPFEIQNPLKNDLIALSTSPTRASDKLTVQWETGNTENNGFSTIDILYSTDGGLTYPHLLADGVPNDGEHMVRPPEIDTDQARLRIELSDGTGRMKIYQENKGNFTVSFSITPIEIADFTAQEDNGRHQISWVLNNTGEHIQAASLQYSYDGITFSSVDLTGFEALNNQSEWSDIFISDFIQGLQTYYRLLVENTEGRVTYSPVVRVENRSISENFLSISPNPVTNSMVRLEFQSFLKPEARVVIWSGTGQKMQEFNMNAGTKTLLLPVNYPDGVYIVELIDGADTFHQKMVVQ